MAEALGGRYELHERIGAGGMGAVYRATDGLDGSAVAVKVIRPEVSSDTSVERFAREAGHAARVRHRNIVEVLDSGVSDDGELYLVMELLEGLSLEERLEMLPPPTVREVIDWVVAALEGLAVVHEAGIIHRDLKPGNLFLAEDGGHTTVKVLDFGLARSIRADGDGQQLPSLTQTHQFLGTPYYMSPEQVRSAKHIDHRADVFSVGVILYECLAGRRPFDGRSASAVIAAIVADDPIDLSELRPDLPPNLLAAVRRALARKPDERFSDARTMREALESVGDVEELRVTPRDVSATAPTALDESPRRPKMSPTVSATPVAGSGGVRMAILGVVAGVAIAGALAFLFVPGPGGDAARDGGSTGTAPVDGPAPDAEAPAGIAHRLAGPDDLPELASRFRAVAEGAGRAGVRFIPEGDGWIAVSLADVSASAARRMAARMGSEAAPLERAIEGALVPGLYRTTVSLNVREWPDARSELTRTLPRGAVVVGLTGTHEGYESKLGATGSWMWIVATPTNAGWSASRYLERDTGCLPSVASVVETLGDEDPSGFHSDTIISRAQFREEGESFEGFLTLARDRERSRSYVSVLRRDEVCALTEVLQLPIRGWVVDVLMSETEREGGDTLLLIAWRSGPLLDSAGMETWTGYRIGGDGSVFSAVLPSSQHLPRSRRANLAIRREVDDHYYPVRVRQPNGALDFYVWDGERLVVEEVGSGGQETTPPVDDGAEEAGGGDSPGDEEAG